MILGFLNLPWFLWAGVAFIISGIYTIVWPKNRITETTGFRYFVVRWGHALTWDLLTINFILRGISTDFIGIANIIALIGAGLYLLFILISFVLK